MNLFQGIWRDLVYAGRSLMKAKAFTFVCVVSLGIGMSPVIAIPYAARVMTMPPPAIEPDGLVEVYRTPDGPDRGGTEWSYPDFTDLREADTGIEMMGWAGGTSDVAIQARTLRTPTLFVTTNYFRILNATLARGPGFDETADPVVILAYSFWQNRLNSDPDIVGKTLTLDGMPHVVVGLAPELFEGHMSGQGAELFVPLQRHPRVRADNNIQLDRSTEWVRIHGRLAPGVRVAQASAAVAGVTSQPGVAEPYFAIGNRERSGVTFLQLFMLTPTGMVLLVVCLNISGMMQVRSAMREREMSIRQAVGANRGRLIQYLLSEATILAGLGGTLAALVLFNLPAALSWWIGTPIPPQLKEALRVDLWTVAICIGVCLATSLLFGLLPALRFSRPVIISALKDDAGVGGFRVGRAHRATAALQVAIAVPLLVMSGISLDRVRAAAVADFGFDSDLLYAAPANLDNADFQIRSVRDNLARASGVASVTVADRLPLDFDSHITTVTRVGDGYLNTMGISLLRGRGITAEDVAGTEPVTVISTSLAERMFPNVEAIGQQFPFVVEENAPQQLLRIVGVIEDVVTWDMTGSREQILVALAQHPASRVLVVVRSTVGEQPMAITTALEAAIRDIDPDFEPASIITGASLRENSMDNFLRQSALAGLTGGVILMLAALGIYGVVGLMVATRTREIAVRVALGATRRRVIGMILFDVARLATPGVAAGLILTTALIRINFPDLGISLSNVGALPFVCGAAIAILVAVLTSLIPARRAASVQPMVAMRTE